MLALILSLATTPALADEPVDAAPTAPSTDPISLDDAPTATPPLLPGQQTTEVTLDVQGPPQGFGMGIVIGEPTGLTFALRPDEMNAVQFHASWSLIADRLRLSADYLRTLAVARADGWSVPFYVGLGGLVGARLEPDEALAVGGRVPIGFAVHPADTPIEPFLEVAPGVLILPETVPLFEGALGVRYYF